MDAKDILIDGFGRLPDLVHGAVHGLMPEQLRWAPAEGANSVGWLVWHLTRVQDSHVAELVGQAQVWESDEIAGRFGLAPDPANSGYGHRPADVAAVRPESAQALLDYYGVVHA